MKKYEHYRVEDFLQDELFVQWCYSATPELTEFWQVWCKQYPEKVTVLQSAKEIIQSVEYKEQESASEETCQRILEGVLQGSGRDTKISKIIQPQYWQSSWKVASILLIMAASAVFYLGRQDVQEKESNSTGLAISYVEKYCPAGKKMNVVLEDGTKVKLNADTYLRYKENFGDSLREVELIGEAFFEVAKDPERPFVIRSQQLQTTVLGTSFNVQAYPDSKVLDVAVVEGLVQVSSTESTKGLDSNAFFLTKGEKLSYHTNEALWKKDIVPIASIGRWRNWELVFEQEDIIGIARKLERWYGVKVIVEGPFSRTISFSGTYINNNLYAVLEGIAYATKLRYSVQGDTVYIKP